jgi:hypothetical protein
MLCCHPPSPPPCPPSSSSSSILFQDTGKGTLQLFNSPMAKYSHAACYYQLQACKCFCSKQTTDTSSHQKAVKYTTMAQVAGSLCTQARTRAQNHSVAQSAGIISLNFHSTHNHTGAHNHTHNLTGCTQSHPQSHRCTQSHPQSHP